MNAKQLAKLGLTPSAAKAAARLMGTLAGNKSVDRKLMREKLAAAASDPEAMRDDPHVGTLARAILDDREARTFRPRDTPAPVKIYGDDLQPEAIDQIENAARLPVAAACALMPDAHLGYGLPIGGVLATRNAVVPYAVGVDIACRMRLSVYDVPAERLEGLREKLKKAIEGETRFGLGANFERPRDHEVMDRDWSVSPITKKNHHKARTQLGTSGSGNHFVEFGTVTLDKDDLGLPAGSYLALLSHSGSRGTGASVCDFYSRLAAAEHPDLPKGLSHLAWLDLDTEAGQEYWNAMNLMGEYAAANHELIHKHVAKAAGLKVAATVENHHNFAWKERHGGEDVIVHRKGATPAGKGVLGVIPGSMATPGYVVRGRGEPASLESASHGAGRVMSRRQATHTFRWNDVRPMLEKANVEVMSAGLDEVPGVYKDINAVMAAQTDLVDVVARFNPRLVKMAPAGEKAED